MRSLRIFLTVAFLAALCPLPAAGFEEGRMGHAAKVSPRSIMTFAASEGWHVRSPMALFGVAFGKDMFVAVGESGTVLTSHDGKAWGSAPIGTNVPLRAVAYGWDAFVAVGDNGAGRYRRAPALERTGEKP